MKANNIYNVIIANEAYNFTATKYNTILTGFASVEDANNAAYEALRDIQGEIGYNKTEKRYNETLGVWVLYNPNTGAWLMTAKIEEATKANNTTPAICPLDFDTVHDAYNYAMAHRHDENPLAVAIPTDAHGTDYGHSLALNGVKLFGVWSDALDSTANGYVYTTEAGAIEAMKQVEENDKEVGIYEPDYYRVLDMTKYFI